MTADVPEAAHRLAAELADAFETDRGLAERLKACQRRLRAANGRLWSGLHPDARGLVYDDVAAVGQGSSAVAEGIVDAVRSGGSAAEIEAAVLGELQEAHWTIHRARADRSVRLRAGRRRVDRAGGPPGGRAPARRGGIGAMSATKPRSSSTSTSASTSRRRPPEVLSEAEAIALLKACSSRAPSGVRNRALIAVLWRCGLRISEALALELRDVDLEAGTVRVRHGKGDRSRTVGLDEQTTAMLARWIDRRKKLSPGARAPIFCTLQGGRINSSYVRRLLPRLAHKAGSTGGCTPTASDTPTPQS